MYRRILCALDFTPVSRLALEQAVALAELTGGTVELVHVWEKPHYVGPDVIEGLGGIDQGALTREAERNARQELDRFAGEVARELTLFCMPGDPATEIVMVAERERADLLVIGTHARTGVSWWVRGSIAETVIRTAPCPVLTVRLGDH